MQMPLPQMEKKKTRLTDDKRKRIERMLDDGWTPYRIAKTPGRPPKTVMRETFAVILTDNGTDGVSPRADDRTAESASEERQPTLNAGLRREPVKAWALTRSEEQAAAHARRHHCPDTRFHQPHGAI